MIKLTFIPTDFTGKAPGNLRSNESHQLITVAGKRNRAFVCKHGAFYSKSMQLRDAAGKLLTQGKDYKTTYYYEDASVLAGQEIMGLVIVTNTAVTSPVKVTYQALGGPFSISADELMTMLDALDDKNFPFVWGDIIGKPSEYAPDTHGHEYWQLYGLDTSEVEINRIADAMKYGHTALMRENSTYADEFLKSAKTEIDKLQLAIGNHVKDFNNPHRDTTAHVQRELLNNWLFSTPQQIADATNKTSYLPIGGVFQLLNSGAMSSMDAHIKNFNNPHGTTADHINAFSRAYIDQQLATKLKWTDTATNSKMWGGRDDKSFENDCRLNIPATAITSGRFPYNQIATGWNGTDPTNHLLVGSMQWLHWQNFIGQVATKRDKIAAIGFHNTQAELWNILNASFQEWNSWPVGSIALGQVRLTPYDTVQYRTIVFQRTGANWQQVTKGF